MFFRHVVGHLHERNRERLSIRMYENENRLIIELDTLLGVVSLTSTALYQPSLNDIHESGSLVVAAPEPTTSFIVNGPPAVTAISRLITNMDHLLEFVGLVEGVPGIVERINMSITGAT